MRTFKFTPQADAQLADVVSWWRTNRTAAPDAVVDEVERVLNVLVDEPGVGPLARDVELPGVHRVTVHRIRYYLYYRFDDETLEVLALWHTSRGAPPPL